MKVLFLLFIINCSSIVYKTQTKDFKIEVNSFKRIEVQISKKNLNDIERKLLYEIIRKELSHRTEYIVYSSKDKSKKIEAIFYIDANFKKTDSKLEVNLIGQMVEISSQTIRWHTKLRRKYSLPSTENGSIVSSYTEEFGNSITELVHPFFDLSKSLIAELESPKNLSDDEQLEKIEVESR